MFSGAKTAALAVACALATAAHADPGRRGDIVRIKRTWGGPRGHVMACPVTPMHSDRLTCFGNTRPRAGDTFALVDSEGLQGRVSAARIESSDQDSCGFGAAYDVFVGSRLPDTRGLLFALRGVDLSPRARSLPAGLWNAPSGGDERVWLAIDETGDSDPELVATVAECSLPPGVKPPPPGVTAEARCIDYWVKARGSWQKRSSDVFVSCN